MAEALNDWVKRRQQEAMASENRRMAAMQALPTFEDFVEGAKQLGYEKF